MSRYDRAQSETVGNILIIGIVVVLVTSVSVGVIANLTGGGVSSEQTPRVDFTVEVTDTNITLGHNGGTALNATDIRLRLSTDSGERDIRMDSANITGGDSDGDYEPGETFHRKHGLSGENMDILIVDTDTSTLLLDTIEPVE